MLLSDKEIQRAWVDKALSDNFEEDITKHAELVAKAQLKKVVEWGNEPCKDRTHNGEMPRRWCWSCWQALLKETE